MEIESLEWSYTARRRFSVRPEPEPALNTVILREKMVGTDLTPRILADSLGASPQVVYNWLRNYSSPKWPTIMAIAVITEVTPWQIIRYRPRGYV